MAKNPLKPPCNELIMRSPLALLFTVALLPISGFAEEPAKEEPPKKEKPKKKRNQKSPVKPADYAQWERLDSGNRQFSPDGKWLIYGVTRVDEERTLRLHRLTGKKMPEVESFQHGTRPVFSNNSAWLAVTIGKSPAEAKKESKEKLPGATTHLRNLANKETTVFKNVSAFHFSEDSRFAAIEVNGKSAGKALIVRNLSDKSNTTFGNVTQHAWSDQGSHLAMVIDSPSISNSLQVFSPKTGMLRTLDSSELEYKSLQWRKDSLDLAVMREKAHAEKEDVSHSLLAWKGVAQKKLKKHVYDHTKDKSFSADMFLPAGRINWAKDGTAIYCDLKKWENKPKAPKPKTAAEPKKEEKKKEKDAPKKEPQPKKETKEKEAPEKKPQPKKEEETKGKTLRDTLQEKSNVEVWHTKDTEIMPLQKKQASSQKNPSRKAIWWLGKESIVQLGNDLTERIEITRKGNRAIGIDRTPHKETAMFGPRLQDVYKIDAKTGEREKILEGLKYVLSKSPDGRHLLYMRDGQLWSRDLESNQDVHLGKDLDVQFSDEEDDTLAVEKRPYGQGIWLKDSSAFLMYDRYDLWLISPNGSSITKMTNGRNDRIRHRLSQANFLKDNDGLLEPDQQLYLALYGDRTKKSGYGKLEAIRSKKPVEVLVWEDKMISSLTRAKNVDRYLFSIESGNDSPDIYVSGPNLARRKQISKTNLFQKQFYWGRTELIDFENKNGVKLQGSLRYPANYRAGKKYPMIVYIYEKRSQGLHRYEVPSEKHPYNPAVFSAEGYFVFQPDIVYRPQEPGISALECVVPAVEQVLKTGMVDKEKVGLVGHSWGAYQTAFIVTRSDLFAAGVAGAPLTNMMSMSVSVYWNSGQTNAAIFTQSQGRMDKPFWQDPENYIRNSPIHGLDDLNTPLLIAFGDKDGAVDWGQGVQMYNAARWAGKENLVMLVYPGENHSLRKEENMVDYHYRVREWFDTHVKGHEAPKWITEGKSFLERQKEKEDQKDKPQSKAEKIFKSTKEEPQKKRKASSSKQKTK